MLQAEPAIEIIQNKSAQWTQSMVDSRIPRFYANV
jgi:hypothetical protein